MPACQECYRVKVRCDREELKNGTCSRCTRLEIDCVPRVSRQGQGPKKRQRNDQQQQNKQRRPQKLPQSNNTAAVTHSSEDGGLLEAFNKTTSPPMSEAKYHYGIRYLIHSWSSFALARRSFSLLGRASQLAAKCGVPMDDIFCDSRRHIINPIIFGDHHQEAATDDSTATPLHWDNLPTSLRQLCRLDRTENRYIWVREAKNGHSRFLVSDKFQKEIVSLWMIEQTWKSNEKPVVQLFLQGQDDFDKFTKAIHYEISRYTHPGKKPDYVRMNGVNVLFNDRPSSPSNIKEMDLVYAFEILNLEHSVYVCEFVHPRQNQNKPNDKANDLQDASGIGEPDKSDSLDEPLQLFDNLLPLEDMDEDLEAFLALIND